MKSIISKGSKQIGEVVQSMPEKVGSAFREELNNLNTVMKGSTSMAERLYAGVTFLDPQAWAEKHPEVIKPATVTVLGVVGTACPITIPIAAAVGFLPENVCATLMDLGNRPCPPYLLRQFLKRKMKAAPEEENVIMPGYGSDPEVDCENRQELECGMAV